MADRTITLTENGEEMPLSDIVTGRGFVTGKSGSGKSNTCSVLAEELLEKGVPLLIIDTDGEYFGLKEQYELLHVGGDDRCDLKVGPQHADKLADVAIDSRVPIILDISGFLDQEDAHRLVHDVVRALFVKEKEARIPFLLFVEEAHEFIPEQGGLDETGEMLIRVAKRGRKRGLGTVAISQRPASVDKDFITQCDWLVWHRLTWDNDTQVVSKIMGSQAADEVQTLDPGEAILMTDWDERRRRVQFRRKRTLDAGATPDFDDVDQPDMKSVGGDLVDELAAAGASVTDSGEEAFTDDDADGETAADADGDAGAAPADGETDAEDAREGTADGESVGADDRPASANEQSVPAEQSTQADDQSTRADDQSTQASGASADAAAGEYGPDVESGTGDADGGTSENAPSTAAQAETAPAPADGDASAGSPPASASANGGTDTEATLEQVARNVQPREPARSSGGRNGRGPSPKRADDPVWEVAEFVAYLVASVGAATVQVATRVRRAVVGLVSDGPVAPSAGRETEGRPVIGALVTVALLLLGILLGIGAATLLA